MTLQVHEPVLSQKSLEIFEALAVRPADDPFSLKLFHCDAFAIGQPMALVYSDHERLSEQRPTVEPFPFALQRPRHAEIRAALLEMVGKLGSGPAEEIQLHAGETVGELGQLRQQNRNVYRGR